MTTPADIETKKMMVLDAIRYHGASLSKACRDAKIAYATIVRARDTDEDFAAELESASMERADILEDAAFERAVNGVVTESTKYHGALVTQTIKHSDSLLAKLLDGAKPDVYARRNITELTGKDGEALVPMDDMAMAARMASLLETLEKRRAEAQEANQEEDES